MLTAGTNSASDGSGEVREPVSISSSGKGVRFRTKLSKSSSSIQVCGHFRSRLVEINREKRGPCVEICSEAKRRASKLVGPNVDHLSGREDANRHCATGTQGVRQRLRRTAEQRGSETADGTAKVRMVENIEDLGAKA